MPNKENIYKQLNGRCAYCGKGMTLKDATRDHVVPKSKGGGNNVKNLLPTCKKCNQMKGDMKGLEGEVVELKGSEERYLGIRLSLLGCALLHISLTDVDKIA